MVLNILGALLIAVLVGLTYFLEKKNEPILATISFLVLILYTLAGAPLLLSYPWTK